MTKGLLYNDYIIEATSTYMSVAAGLLEYPKKRRIKQWIILFFNYFSLTECIS